MDELSFNGHSMVEDWVLEFFGRWVSGHSMVEIGFWSFLGDG
jgi:hypothetical protein